MAADYRRKISGEEAQGRYIIITKSGLEFFPKPGKPFKLKIGDKKFEAFLEAHEVWSMGPKKPAQIIRIDAKPFWDVFSFHFGQTVTITKEKDKLYKIA